MRFGLAVKVGCVAFGSGKVRRGGHGWSGFGMVRFGLARLGMAWRLRHVQAGRGVTRRGGAGRSRLGKVRPGRLSYGVAGLGGHVEVRRGRLWFGKVRPVKAVKVGFGGAR